MQTIKTTELMKSHLGIR